MKKPMRTLSQEQTKLVSGGSSLEKIREDLKRARDAMEAAKLNKLLREAVAGSENVNY